MTAYESDSNGGMAWFFNHLPSILWQRRLLVGIPFFVVTLGAAIAAFALPTIYRSSASLLVQSQEFNSSLVPAPAAGQIEQRIARIRERVLSRGDLIQLIQQNNLYPNERSHEPLSKIVEKMRNSTTVGAENNDIGQAGTQDTVAINISFDYPNPALAQAVLQSFVNSFLTMDTQDVADQARLNVRLLQDQANKLRTQITAIENNMTDLKARNGSALASSGSAPILDLGSYSAQITTLETQNRQLVAQAARPSKDPQLAAAESALTTAQSLYSDSHPDVQAARERLRAVRQMIANNPGPDDTATIRSQIAANNSAIASLQQARSAAMARAQSAMAGSARAPAILEQATQMENQATTLRDQYKSVSDDLLKAQTAARLANEQQAERLSLAEPPSLPDRPYSPNRPLLIIAGAVLGLLLGLGSALGLELMRRPLRSPLQIESLGLPILGVVPLFTDKTKPSRLSQFIPKRYRKVA